MSNSIIAKSMRVIVNAVLIFFSITCVYPVIWMIYSSLKTTQEFSLNIVSLPAHPQFINYIQAIKVSRMGTYFFNSLFVTSISVTLIMLSGFVISYFLSRFSFKGRNLIYLLFLSGMLIPVYGLLVPTFVQLKMFGMLNTRYTLLLPYVAFGLPTAVLLIESFIKSIPIHMEEAALIDGSSIVNTMFRIILPICRPVISTTLILSFLSRWNEFPFALVLNTSDKLKTLTVGLTNFSGENTVDYTRLMAALVIATMPVIIVYILFSKKIIQGMTAGAIKG
jgi:raffinose/stachyose/melibiose transport system permease protein